ncbi:SMR family transporter [Gammaproteobacteria bacterium]|nr:SMR family transporter [Gammaproteobacteria bacterium]
MKNYLLLFVAIGLEVLGTMLLPATQSFTKLLPSTVSAVSYMLSVSLLAVLAQKLPLAVIYSSWAGLGVFSVALLSYIFYKQALNWQTIAGLFLIVLGVTIVNMFKGESV